jgi:RHS repeat-associated protein
MATFRVNGVLQASYRYDYLGRQVSRALTGGLTIHSVFDSAGNRIAEYNQATGALIREYIWLDGAPIAVVEGGVIYYIRTDHIGRPVFATNAAGVKVWTASYLPFGGVRVSTGVPLALRFPGQWFQSESGLHQNWMRDYDPTTGRYIQADPLGLVDGASIYGYVNGNPGNWVDPRGEEILLLGPSPSLASPNWSVDPSYRLDGGVRWDCSCNDGQIVFHNDDRNHWHYYPEGEKTGGRKAYLYRYHGPDGDHLYPPYLLTVPDCPSGGFPATLPLLLLSPKKLIVGGGGKYPMVNDSGLIFN